MPLTMSLGPIDAARERRWRVLGGEGLRAADCGLRMADGSPRADRGLRLGGAMMTTAQKILARSYWIGHVTDARSARAAPNGQYGSARSVRPRTTRSASSFPRICSAMSAVWIRPTAAVAIDACWRTARANGT